MLAHYTMERGETIMKTAAGGMEPHSPRWELHCVSAPSIFCPLSSLATLCPAPGYLSRRSRECLETSHRHPLVCPAPRRVPCHAMSLILWRGTAGPGNWFSPCCVMQSPGVATGAVPGVKYAETRKYWRENIFLDEIDIVSGVIVTPCRDTTGIRVQSTD